MTLQADTLVCDTARVAFWQSNPDYDYNRELMTPEIDIYGWLSMQLSKLLRAIFGSRFAEEYSGIILIIIAILILLQCFMMTKVGRTYINFDLLHPLFFDVCFVSEQITVGSGTEETFVCFP